MQVKFSSTNRITIPRDVMEKLKLKPGMILDLDVIDSLIVMKVKDEKLNNDMLQEKEINDSQMSDPKRPKNMKIVSNLEEAENFYRKCYSSCGLVVRTKNSYVDKFCEQCRGELLNDYEGEYNCPYVNGTVKRKPKAQKANKQHKTVPSETFKKESSKTIKFVWLDKNYLSCVNCKELHNSGVLLNGKFNCYSCAKKDFQKFFEEYKKIGEEN